MTYTRDIIGIEEFANCCDFVLRGNVLTASCHLRDPEGNIHKLERSVDLKPAIDYVSRQMAAWHAQQHGQDAMVAGWTDIISKAVSTVKKVAQSKTVQSLYAQAKPFLKSAVTEIPGGKTTMELATKAADVYDKAKNGSQKALAAVKKVQAMAKTGDQKAQFAVKVMQNVGTLVRQKAAGLPAILPQVAHAMQTQQAVRDHRSGTSYYQLGVTSVSGEVSDYNNEWKPHYDIVGNRQQVGSFWSKARWAVPGYAAYRGAKAVAHAMHPGKSGRRQVMDHRAAPSSPGQVNKQWGGRKGQIAPAQTMDHDSDHPMSVVPPITPDLASLMMPPPAGAPAQPTTPDLPTPDGDPYGGQGDPNGASESAYVDDAYYDDGSDDGPYEDQQDPVDQEVSGWTYNRPYRSLSQQVLQSQKSPGVAAAARELYNRGLGRPDTTLTQLALEALHQLG